MGTYCRIGLLRSYGNLQSYWTTTKLWKLTVVLDYYEAMETYGRIGLLIQVYVRLVLRGLGDDQAEEKFETAFEHWLPQVKLHSKRVEKT